MTPPVLDLDRLTAPLPGGDPAGAAPVRYSRELADLRKWAVEGRKSDNEPPLPPGHPGRVELWRAVLNRGRDLLAEHSKSLEAATRVAEAAARVHGPAGLRDGLALLRRLTDEAWDRVWPKVEAPADGEPADLEGRANQFYWLDDPDGGGLFPHTVRELAVAEVGGVVVSPANCRAEAGREPRVGPDGVASVAAKLGPDAVRAARDGVAAAAAELDALAAAVGAKFAAAGVPKQAPSFGAVREALGESLRVADDLAAALAGEAPAGPGEAAAPPPGEGPGSVDPAGKFTREALYRQLTQVADHLSRLEPHSPVPLLLRRVVELRDLAFPDLVRHLTRDQQVLGFLSKSLPAGEE